MKRIILLSTIIVAGAMSATISAKKKQKTETAKQPVVLTSSADTLSYTAGVSLTDGLIPFIANQGVDTMYMADFVRGFNELIASNDDPKLKAYAMGLQIATQVKMQMLKRMKDDFTNTPDSISDDIFFRGFGDALIGDTAVFTVKAAQDMFKQKQEQNQKAPGEAFLAENAKKEGVVVLPSGLQYKVLQAGEGKTPQKGDKVKVHYEGRLIDGTVFDASKRHGDKPAEFGVTDVIKGWTEALLLMPVGSKWQLYIPYDLAYGERGTGRDIKPYSTLVFDVELVDIVEADK
ncbi:MAG: FKBP-type peptidyl-prolyl cis-trans isomerase [Prevotella sp.]|nr:FKBP-type peptidyl-prolyl cis-trans isomerase [Prevotella sp.]